ncbi:MAG TPA: peptidase M3 [Bacteroidales bacterium]|nr:peptidase M3 [Bacteroidales bacterium]
MLLNDIAQNSNPLLAPFNTPYGAPPFSNIMPEHYLPAFAEAIKMALSEVEAIAGSKEEPNFKNTIDALSRSGKILQRVSNVFFPLYHAESNSQMQEVARNVAPMLADYQNDIVFNPLLFDRVKCVYSQGKNLPLNQEESTLLEKTYKMFVRNGAGLHQSVQNQLREIVRELSSLSVQFTDNVLAETNNWYLHITEASDLAGLPPMQVDAAALEADSRGLQGWCITLKGPSYLPFLQYSHNRELRERVFKAYNQRCFADNPHNNTRLVLQIVALRKKMAQLLGYETYAHFVLEESMAQTPEKVTGFLNQLLEAYKPFAKSDLEKLRLFAKNSDGAAQLEYWDWYYYAEKLRKQEYDFDQEELRPYFPLEKVIDGIFQLSNILWGISFKETTNVELYHPEVKAYEVCDKDGNFLALLYLDFFPRDGKSPGAWMTSFRDQEVVDGVDVRPIVSLVCNFTKPTQSAPSLLTHNEFNTFLHEWGHALHGIFSQVKYSELSGTNVYRDFVELPSQFMENWALEERYLKLFARHYATGEEMPLSLIQNLVAAKNYQTAFAGMRQLSFGLLDMAWHGSDEIPDSEIQQFEQQAIRDAMVIPMPAQTCTSVSFGHIFSGGYAAGYYSYKWAEVLDADAFSLFAGDKLFDAQAAESFRRHILAKGGTEHPMVLYKRFMGREPALDALLKWEGLL